MNKLLILCCVMTLISCAKGEEYRLTLLHVNDTHAKHDASIRTNKTTGAITTNGGESQFAGVIQQERAKNPNTLLLHSGDTLTGSAYTLIYKGIESSELMNINQFDVATLGNHEFDFGVDGAYNLLNVRNFPTVAVNVFETDTEKRVVEPYILTNIDNKTIAIIGVVTSDQVYTQKLGSKGYVTISNEIESLSNLFTTDQKISQADIHILLSHSGFDKDQEIAKAFPNKFAVIVGGHSHTLLTEPVKIGKTLIVQLDNNLKRVGRLDLIFKGNKIESIYEQIPLVNTAQSEEITQYLNEKRKLVTQQMGIKIGELTGSDLSDELIRQKSTPLGNFLSDLLFDIYQPYNIDFVLLNSGSIRTSIMEGDLSLQTLFELHPFDNTAYVVTVSGKTLQEILQLSIGKNWDEGGFLQLSKGIIVQLNNQRNIQSIQVNGEVIDPTKEYTILMSDWLFNGGDGYTMIKPNAIKALYVGTDFRDMLIDKIKTQKTFFVDSIDKTDRWKFE